MYRDDRAGLLFCRKVPTAFNTTAALFMGTTESSFKIHLGNKLLIHEIENPYKPNVDSFILLYYIFIFILRGHEAKTLRRVYLHRTFCEAHSLSPFFIHSADLERE